MPSDQDRIAQRLIDIVQNIDAAKAFVAGLDFDGFMKNLQARYAVVRALEIISEASRHIPEDFKVRHPHIEWQQIRAAGNVYRHGYPDVSYDIIWNTVQRALDGLRAAAVGEVESLGRGDYLRND